MSPLHPKVLGKTQNSKAELVTNSKGTWQTEEGRNWSCSEEARASQRQALSQCAWSHAGLQGKLVLCRVQVVWTLEEHRLILKEPQGSHLREACTYGEGVKLVRHLLWRMLLWVVRACEGFGGSQHNVILEQSFKYEKGLSEGNGS